MLIAKDLIRHFHWRNADGPLDVWMYGRFSRDGGQLTIHGIVINNVYVYSRDGRRKSRLPRPMDLAEFAFVRLREGLLNGDHIQITTPAGRPSIDYWYGGQRLWPNPRQRDRGYRLEWHPRGRPHRSVVFQNGDEFRHLILRLMSEELNAGTPLTKVTQNAISDRYGFTKDGKPLLDAREIRRYCTRFGYVWHDLKQDAYTQHRSPPS